MNLTEISMDLIGLSDAVSPADSLMGDGLGLYLAEIHDLQSPGKFLVSGQLVRHENSNLSFHWYKDCVSVPRARDDEYRLVRLWRISQD